MAADNILTLNKPMAPRFIQILYWIAMILIAVGVVYGVAVGVRTMTRSMPQRAAMAAPGAPGAMAVPGATMSAPGNPRAGAPMHRPGFGFRRFHGPRFAPGRPPGFMMGPMMRGMPPAALGGLRILLALLRGIIAIMIIRVLAEIGTAILAMGAKAK